MGEYHPAFAKVALELRCLRCGLRIDQKAGPGRARRYCSPRCKVQARQERLRPRTEKVCCGCGQRFQGTLGRKFCSRACRARCGKKAASRTLASLLSAG
jgi:hypothetical protein